ncbi:MAG: MFS transporter [Bryobacteraceae bacterium]|nr:MFS transporter [Bryobacteraceae bacterium]
MPPAVAAALDALRFDAEPGALLSLNDGDWRRALAWCDRNQLTLAFWRTAGYEAFPEWVRERLGRDAQKNEERFRRIRRLYGDLRGRFLACGLQHLALKGFAQWPYFTDNPASRPQYDLDLFFPADTVHQARDIVADLSYEPIGNLEALPTDHLPTMIRKTGWQWRGDFFDPEIPVAIDLHFRFWDRGTERFGPERLDAFWERREERSFDGLEFASLCADDALGYACLHALRHLLRGDARPAHFYEIGWFLHREHGDSFWRRWNGAHDRDLRRIEAVVFGVARAWFGSRLAPAAGEAVEQLPPSVKQWLERRVYAPIESPFHPNKEELWLHLALVSSRWDKAAIVRRRLAPMRLPRPFDAVHVADDDLTWRIRLRALWRYAVHVVSRLLHHGGALASLGLGAPRWWAASAGLSSAFWVFFVCAALFNFGVFVFFLLYNLYLLDRGFAEDFLGVVTAAFTAGNIAGSLIAGFLVARIGLRRSLLLCFVSVGLVSAVRVVAVSEASLVASAFLGGVCACFWFVGVPLAVAQLTNDRNRPLAFSLTMGSGIAVGALAGVIGGKLPALLGSKESALLVGCALALTAAAPALKLRLGAAATARRGFTRHPFLIRFLVALALWSFATGAFNPFFNVYFSRSFGLGVERIGWVFSASQAAQVGAILLAPLLFRRFGLAPAVAMTQAATACAMAALGFAPAAAAAAFLYLGYMAFQNMGEPGMYSLLMNRLPPADRTGAAALNFLVLFGAHALAASLAGLTIARFGYPTLLVAAAVIALIAALLVRALLHEPSGPSSSPDTKPA